MLCSCTRKAKFLVQYPQMYNFPPVFHQTIHFLRCCWRGVIRILEQLSQVYLSHTNFSHCSHHISFHNITFHNISFHNISPFNPISISSIILQSVQTHFQIWRNTEEGQEAYFVCVMERRTGAVSTDWIHYELLCWRTPVSYGNT